MKILAIFSLVMFTILLISGCATISKTQVITNPPGAKIEVNDDYICDAPCEVTLKRYYDTFSSYYKSVTIKAIPIGSGQCLQTKYISSYDKMPNRIYFEMYLCSPKPSLDVDVNIKER